MVELRSSSAPLVLLVGPLIRQPLSGTRSSATLAAVGGRIQRWSIFHRPHLSNVCDEDPSLL